MIVAYLAPRKIDESEQLDAYAIIDDASPVRVSDEGSGATSVELVKRGDALVAVYLDTRSAMTPVHARPLAVQNGMLVPGVDVVMHVAGPPERGIDFVVGTAGARIVALLPTAKGVSDFGVAALPVDDPPAHDVEPAWSLYPNGIDPAPIAVTRDGASMLVARVRPADSSPGASRVIELGRIEANRVFTSFGAIGENRKLRVTDVAIADGPDGLWILYGDAQGSWLERRKCP